jgi:hypothetical protein
MATCNFFFFKYGDFRVFFGTQKNAFLPFAFFGRQNTKISREKKQHCQVLAFSLIFSCPLFCASHKKGIFHLRFFIFE